MYIQYIPHEMPGARCAIMYMYMYIYIHVYTVTYVTVHAKRDYKSANFFFEISADFALLFPFLPSYKI